MFCEYGVVFESAYVVWMFGQLGLNLMDFVKWKKTQPKIGVGSICPVEASIRIKSGGGI